MSDMIDQISGGKPEMALIILMQNAKGFENELLKFMEIKPYLRKESINKYLAKITQISKNIDDLTADNKSDINKSDLRSLETLIIKIIMDLDQIFNKETGELYIKDLRKALNIVQNF